MTGIKHEVEKLAPIILFLIVTLAFFGKVISSGNTLYGSDFIFYFYPVKHFLYEYICTNGSLPFWNPYLFSGTPFVANIQASMFYPLGFLYYLIPTEIAYLYSTILHCILGSIFMYRFMRSLSVSKPGSFLSGFIFIFNGYFMAHLYAGHLSFVQNYIWIPLIFLFAVRFMEFRKLKHALLGGLFLGVQILGGFPQIAFYTIISILLLCFYFVCKYGQKNKGLQRISKITTGTLVLLLTGFSMAAIQLLPTYEFAQLSTRVGGISYQFATSDSLPPVNLLTFLVPLLFGTPVDGTFWINDSTWEFWEYCGYVGIGALTITAITVRKLISDRLGLFFVMLIATTMFLALGKYNPVYPIIYHFPGFNNFRIPAQIIFLYIFSIAVLTGKGLDFLKGSKALSVRSKRIVFLVLFFFLPFMIWSYGFTDNFSNFLLQHIQFTGMTVEQIYRVASVISHAIFVSYGILLAVAVSLYLYDKESISYSVLATTLIFISIVDLGSFSSPMIQATDIKHLLNKGKSLNYITQNPIISRTAINGRCFIENAGLWYGFQDIQGYDPLILKRYMEYINRSQGLPPDDKVVNLHYVADFNNNLIRLLNLKYVVDCKEKRLWKIDPFTPRCYIVHSMLTKDKNEILDFLMEDQFDPLKVVIFEKENAPATFFPEEPIRVSREKCWITDYNNDEIKLVADMKAPGFLIMSEINYPGWQVFVDGTKESILTGNYLFRVVPLNTGCHDIHFIFSPPSFKIGAAISAISLIGVMAFLFLVRRKRPMPREETT
jgi:hypothetical protein